MKNFGEIKKVNGKIVFDLPDLLSSENKGTKS